MMLAVLLTQLKTLKMNPYFKDEIHKSKKYYKKYKMLTTIQSSFDTIAIFPTTSSSIGLSVTGIGLMAIPISCSVTCGLSISNEEIKEKNMQKYKKNIKQYERDQQTIKLFDNLYRNFLQDNIFDKKEYDSLCNIFTKICR